MQLLLSNNLCATIDMVALALLIIFALYGLIRGFTKTFFSVFGTIIGVMLAFLIAPSVVEFLQNKFFALETLQDSFNGFAKQILGNNLANTPLANATQENLKGIAGFIANIVLSLKNNAKVSTDATIGEAVASIFAYYALLLICAVVLLIILKIAFFIISEVVKKAYKNKLIASLDRTLGFALGAINGIFNIELIILVIGILPIPILQEISVAIDSTVFTNFIQNINLYQVIFNNIINFNIIGSII